MIDTKYMFVIQGSFLILDEELDLGINVYNLPEVFSTKDLITRKLLRYSDFVIFTRSNQYYLFKNRYNGQSKTFDDINSILNYLDDLPFVYITKDKHLKGWDKAVDILHSLEAL